MDKIKVEKTFAAVSILVSVIIIIVGIGFVASPPMSFSTVSVDEASFGADFYTYIYEATTAASRNGAVAANNVRELGEAMATYTGTFFIFAGILLALASAKKFVLLSLEDKEEKPSIEENVINNDVISDMPEGE